MPDDLLLEAKQRGFFGLSVSAHGEQKYRKNIEADMLTIRKYRKMRGITPYVKQIDTLAAEYPAMTNYLYVTYNGTSHDIEFAHDKRSVIVLGSGPTGSAARWNSTGVASTR